MESPKRHIPAMPPTEKLLDWNQELLRQTLGQTAQLGRTISTWLVAGNAAALALTLGAVLQGTHCDQSLLRAAIFDFACGVIIAFTAGVLGYGAALWTISRMSSFTDLVREIYYRDDRLVRAIEANKSEEDRLPILNELNGLLQKVPERAKAVRHPLWIAGISIALYLASAAFFAFGVLTPVTSSAISLSSCTASKPHV